MTEDAIPQGPLEALRRADSEAPRVYANVFINQLKAYDCTIALFRDDKPIIMLDLSHNTAKALGLQLVELFRRYEADTGFKIPVGEEILAAMGEKVGQDNND